MLIIEILLLIYFIYVVSYTALFSLAGRFYRVSNLQGEDQKFFKFCVLIPAFKEDAVIFETVRRALNQSYPHKYYEVVVIADSLQPSTLLNLKAQPIKVIPVSFEKSTKVKSLNKALEQLSDFDYAIILDADNVMTPEFIERMNDIANATQRKAIQGQRVPKNAENSLSFLDGVSEAINNHIYRQGTTALGLSASINGSGIAIDFQLLKNKLGTMTSVGGFDRELELLLLRENVKVYYYKDACVLDEKVCDVSAFQNQRKRWIASQYFYLKKYFLQGTAALFKGNTTFFNSAVLRNIQLPRLINMGLLFFTSAIFLFARPYLSFSYYWWPALFLINAVAVLTAIPKNYYSFRLVESIAELPALFIRMTTLLFRMKGANKNFIHTPHIINQVQHEQ